MPDGVSNSPTPEDRLLDLIRKQESGPTPASARASLMKGQAPSVALSGMAEKTRQQRWQWPLITVWVLGILIAIELMSMVVLAMRPIPLVDVQVPVSVGQTVDIPQLSALPELSQSVKRVLFVPPPRPVIVERKENKAQETANQLGARLSIKGIISGDPTQAIIEDAETGKTYFATQGQKLMEGAVVESVTETSVILRVDTETIMLNL